MALAARWQWKRAPQRPGVVRQGWAGSWQLGPRQAGVQLQTAWPSFTEQSPRFLQGVLAKQMLLMTQLGLAAADGIAVRDAATGTRLVRRHD